jgi:hypothetical protein
MPDPVNTGANPTYIFQITNHGPASATGITLTDPPAARSHLRRAPASQGTDAHSNGTLHCGLGTLRSTTMFVS